MYHKLFDILLKSKKHKCNSYSEKEIISDSEYDYKKVYLIKSGVVKISSLTEQGEKCILILLTLGQVFGANLILERYHENYIFESLNDQTVLYEFDIGHVKKVIKKHPKIQNDLLLILGEQYLEMQKRINTLSNNSAEQRLINALKEFKDKFGYSLDHEENVIIHMPLNQDEISNYIRTTRVTTNKLFNKLKNMLLIEYRQKSITLKKEFFEHYK